MAHGADASERALNLAMYLSSKESYSSLDDIVKHVEGYDSDADAGATQRMFENDKDFLRSTGFVILTQGADNSLYKIDASGSFASELDLAPHEAAMMRVVGGLVLRDPLFPLKDDLRLALAKLAESLGDSPHSSEDRGGEPRPAQEEEGIDGIVSLCAEAIDHSKHLVFRYPSADRAKRTVYPYGLFSYLTSWYLVALDVDKDEIRVFHCERIHDLSVNTRNPKTPDFAVPEDFDVADFRGLPFQYGDAGNEFVATVLIAPELAWQAPQITQNIGTLSEEEDGRVVWEVEVRDRSRFLSWLIMNGPGLTVLSPASLCEDLLSRLAEVGRIHG